LVSKPGFNADTASDVQLLFNSQGAPYNGVYKTGIVRPSEFTKSSENDSPQKGKHYIRSASVAFGKTFPQPPRVLVNWYDPNTGGMTQMWNYSYQAGQVKGSGSTAENVGSASYNYYTVDTQSLGLYIDTVYYPSGTKVNDAVGAAYVIFSS
jgi:hypothetical protein